MKMMVRSLDDEGAKGTNLGLKSQLYCPSAV